MTHELNDHHPDVHYFRLLCLFLFTVDSKPSELLTVPNIKVKN